MSRMTGRAVSATMAAVGGVLLPHGGGAANRVMIAIDSAAARAAQRDAMKRLAASLGNAGLTPIDAGRICLDGVTLDDPSAGVHGASTPAACSRRNRSCSAARGPQ